MRATLQATASGTSAAAAPRTLVLLGNPNVGKSLIFGLLTGRYVTVSNYPGTTVEVTRGSTRISGAGVEVIDTPGVNTLIPQSEDERVTRDIILERASDGSAHVLQVGDAKNLPRALLLALQLAEMRIPFVLCLNMNDEAGSRGIRIDGDLLARAIGVEVVPTVATRREGIARLHEALAQARPSAWSVAYDERIEKEVAAIEPLLPVTGISRRSLALMALAGDATLTEWLTPRLPPEALQAVEGACRRLRGAYTRSVAYVINQRRLQAAEEVARSATRGTTVSASARWAGRASEAIGAAAMHPALGVLLLAVVLWLMYQFVGVFGAGTAVEWLESGVFGKSEAVLRVSLPRDGPPVALESPPGRDVRLELVSAEPLADGELALRVAASQRGDAGWAPMPGRPPRFYAVPGHGTFGQVEEPEGGVYETVYRSGGRQAGRIEAHLWSGAINPALHAFLMAWVPWEAPRDFLVGPYGLITMGVTYAIAIVLPIVATFFFAFSILEDSGYLPRLAIMVNRAFRVMGLNGKAVLPMVLGLGCDTMATLTTRILETRKERTIVILLLALGVPCSAQLGVIVALLASLSWKATLVWSSVLTGVILLVGFLSSRVLRGSISDFIMEVPPIRMPALGNIAAKTIARVEWYLKEAVPLFLIGTLVLWAADQVHLLGVLERAVSPVVTGVLGLPAQASEAFLIGFLRRDFGSAGLYRLADAGAIDPVQTVVALVTMTLFIPCIANFLMIVKEKGWKVGLMIAGFIFPFAVLVGGALNLALHASGISL